MNIVENMKIALTSIWHHKIRSILTMLGIIIGVCSVIIIVAIGTGAKNEMSDNLFSMDENIVELYYEMMEEEDNAVWEDPNITAEHLAEIQQIPGVKVAMGTNMGGGTIISNEKQLETDIKGIGRDYIYGYNIKLVEGRYFTHQDNDNVNRTLMIDDYTRSKLFRSDEEAIGEIVDINGNPYKIIGVYEATMPGQYREDYGEVLMPRTLVAMMFGSNEIENVSFMAEDPETLAETADMVASELTELLEIENGYMSYWDMTEFVEEFDSFYTVITIFIGSIAGISLLVGGIGVMNIMLVSVTERTREIGLRKAIGATRGKIMAQFLIEAMTITLLGGLLGIVLAVVITAAISFFLPFTAVISPVVVVVGVGFSAFIGIVFGIIPAQKASKLSPIDALRHE